MRLLMMMALAISALSASTVVPVEEWSQAKVSSLGREIYTQDRAAWVATDALLSALTDEEKATVRGWVVLGEGETRTVRFLRAEGDALVPGWDVVVTNGEAAPPAPAADAALTGEALARFQARQTAAENIGSLRCGRYNSVVARDPDSDGWLVWLLASTTEHGVMPVGGHYRFKVSADGRTMTRRDQLSTSCLNMPADPPAGSQGQPVGVIVSHIVSQGPVETHVFLSLQFGTPLYVIVDETLFAVEGDHIREVDMSQ